MQIEMNELVALLNCAKNNTTKNDTFWPPIRKQLGTQIVVLDRGFVYVGEAAIENEFVILTNARNIRRWGTTAGLGELVNGPLKGTVVDACRDLLIPMRAVIHLMSVNGGW